MNDPAFHYRIYWRALYKRALTPDGSFPASRQHPMITLFREIKTI
jgi:hypothetical protein